MRISKPPVLDAREYWLRLQIWWLNWKLARIRRRMAELAEMAARCSRRRGQLRLALAVRRYKRGVLHLRI